MVMRINRRRLIQGALATGALTLMPWPFTAVRAASDEIIRRRIPATGERIPVAGMGTYRTFDIDTGDPQARTRMLEVLRRFTDGGGRVIDSSPMYGRAEAAVGELARELGVTDRLWMATKVWTRGRENGIEQMERSLERMGVATMDLMQVHNLVDLETHLATLKAWKDEGRVRYIGATHYIASRHSELARLIERYPLDFLQFNYNVGERNAEERLLPACRDHGVATLINEPFEQGRLFGRVRGRDVPEWASEIGCRTWAQLFLKFLIGHPGVTAVIPATSDPDHAAENVAAGRGAVPDEAMRERIVEAVMR
jgi:diketogulonate reductase-like aldo/keto reductase